MNPVSNTDAKKRNDEAKAGCVSINGIRDAFGITTHILPDASPIKIPKVIAAHVTTIWDDGTVQHHGVVRGTDHNDLMIDLSGDEETK